MLGEVRWTFDLIQKGIFLGKNRLDKCAREKAAPGDSLPMTRSSAGSLEPPCMEAVYQLLGFLEE